MCGICGIIGDRVGKEKRLHRMMELVEHGGPDGA